MSPLNFLIGDSLKFIVNRNAITLAFKSQYPLIESDLHSKLEEKGFQEPTRNVTVLRISRDGRESIVKRWEKEKTEVFYDPSRGFLSVEGLNIEKTSIGFKEIYLISQELLGETSSEKIKWAEINFSCRCIGQKHPLQSLKILSSADIFNNIENIFKESIFPFSLEFYSSADEQISDKPLTDFVDWSNVSIRPLIANPKYYVISVVYRKNNINKVIEFSSTIKSVVESLLEKIEG